MIKMIILDKILLMIAEQAKFSVPRIKKRKIIPI